MMWEKVKLGDIASFSNGINFNKTAYEKGVKLIGVSNFGDRFYPDYLQLQEVKKDIVRPEDCLRNGDIVFVRSNGNKELVGRCMLVKNPTERVTYSGFCIRARLNDTDRYDPVYFTYYFKSKAFRRAVSGTAVGANIQNLSQARLSNHDCNVPDIETQHRIADILSAYDDLIENNQKQIKLLEEAAQRLYKEWFVDLHFPGHENTKIVDGVPEGWIKEEIGKIIKKVHRTKQIVASEYKDEGSIPIVDQSRAFVAGYTNDLEARVDFGIPIIVFGDHTRIVKLIQFPFAKGADGTQLIISDCLEMPQRLLYCSIMNVDLSNYHYARHFKYLKEEKIMIPTVEVANEFENNVTGIFSKIQNCRDEIIRCQKTRDLLLPKLMSGEVEV
jgi:type I restriction enzyme S subunit